MDGSSELLPTISGEWTFEVDVAVAAKEQYGWFGGGEGVFVTEVSDRDGVEAGIGR